MKLFNSARCITNIVYRRI